MSIAQDILTEFNRTGSLHFPDGPSPSVTGTSIFVHNRQVGVHIFKFPDESELEVVHPEEGPPMVSLSTAYRLRLALALKTSSLYAENECVALRKDLSFQGRLLKADTLGTIVAVYPDHAAYTVEFDVAGESLLPDLLHPDLKPAPKSDSTKH